jgi:DNA-binding HxlR family transcriptional regulator
MNTYTHETLDNKIIAAVKSGKKRFSEIYNYIGAPFRTVDRRLQALRKRGVLSFTSRSGWSAHEAQPITQEGK